MIGMTVDETIGIIVTHGSLAEELLHTVKLIVGETDCCRAISGSNLCDEELTSKIRETIEKDKGKNIILFIDSFRGSCYINAVRAVKDYGGTKVISGVNLPILLDFVTKQGTMTLEEMVKHLIKRGRESVKAFNYCA